MVNPNPPGTPQAATATATTSMMAPSPIMQRIKALGRPPTTLEARIIADEAQAKANRRHEVEQWSENQ
jgi:hypothetical protein